jgi:hypothetical protein
MVVEPDCSAVGLGQGNWKRSAGAALISIARGGPTGRSNPALNLIEHRWTKEEAGLLRDGAQLQ